MKGIKNPTMSILGAFGALLLGLFVKIYKGEIRQRKAETKKEEDKERDLGQLEADANEGADDIFDQLENR